jgi:hypothetical protein
LRHVHFPDNVWLHILGYIARDNAHHLLELTTALQDHPIGRIAQDHSLWTRVSWKGFAPRSELKRIIRYLGSHTKALHIQGGSRFSVDNCQPHVDASKKKRKRIDTKKNKTNQLKGNRVLIDISEPLLRSIQLNCTHLETFSLQDCKFDYFSRPFQGNLPKSLIKISLKRVEIYNNPVIPSNPSSPFFKMQKFLPNVKEICISEPGNGSYTNPDRNCLANNKNLLTLDNVPDYTGYCKELKMLQYNKMRS